MALTTDYGTNDHLVGRLKGVILKINPDVTIVGITHHVTSYDLLDGALAIGSAYSCFPARTIHVVVVDPGVGMERRPLLVTGESQYFIAPDNGVLSLVYERKENALVRHANVEHYFLEPVSKTFHGRDVFAPVAAWLAKGRKLRPYRMEMSLIEIISLNCIVECRYRRMRDISRFVDARINSDPTAAPSHRRLLSTTCGTTSFRRSESADPVPLPVRAFQAKRNSPRSVFERS